MATYTITSTDAQGEQTVSTKGRSDHALSAGKRLADQGNQVRVTNEEGEVLFTTDQPKKKERTAPTHDRLGRVIDPEWRRSVSERSRKAVREADMNEEQLAALDRVERAQKAVLRLEAKQAAPADMRAAWAERREAIRWAVGLDCNQSAIGRRLGMKLPRAKQAIKMAVKAKS